MKRLLFSLLFSAAFLACTDHPDPTRRADILYIQTNNFQANQNAVLAYRVNGSGNLEPLAGSPFLTNGSGVGNPEQLLGPLDSDYELRLSTDGQYLLGVNSGSNTIAVFSIKAGGALEHVAGSPFSSNGQTPVSVDVSGNFVFVLNKSQNPLQATPQLPNYSTFTIDAAGKLTPVAGAKVETTAGSSPSNVLVSRDGKFLFGADFLGFMLMPPVGTLRSFTINGTGGLTPVAGTPYVVPGMGGTALGLWQHPSGSVLYVGNPVQGKVGVYSINASTGALALQTSVPAGSLVCWIRTNKAGNRMYVLNSGDNTVQVYNTLNPLAPVSIQTLELKNSGPSYPGPGGAPIKTSQPFSLVLSSAETSLYVVNQHTNKDFSIGNYNYLHTLKIAADGTLTEEADALQLPVANTIRPKGSVIISR
jgi:6-phosphogluconolactonase (cycloisomerase 2 family)